MPFVERGVDERGDVLIHRIPHFDEEFSGNGVLA